jgi:hypothetical protein
MGQTACKPGSVPPDTQACLTRRPFLWTAHCWTVLATNPGASELRPSCPPHPKRRLRARRPYSVLLQAGLAVPSPSPGPRCALTAPFHPYRALYSHARGGLLSVALSLGSLPAGVTRRLVAVEPGLSSPLQAGERPPGRLAQDAQMGPNLRDVKYRCSGDADAKGEACFCDTPDQVRR